MYSCLNYQNTANMNATEYARQIAGMMNDKINYFDYGIAILLAATFIIGVCNYMARENKNAKVLRL